MMNCPICNYIISPKRKYYSSKLIEIYLDCPKCPYYEHITYTTKKILDINQLLMKLNIRAMQEKKRYGNATSGTLNAISTVHDKKEAAQDILNKLVEDENK